VKAYIGVVVVKAEPADRGGKPGYKVVLSNGSGFWTPKEKFEEAYRALDCERMNK